MHSFEMNEKCVGMQVGPPKTPKIHFQFGSRDSYLLKKIKKRIDDYNHN